ncbi:MAG: sulfotransferase [Anaerolineales bacterium]|nr:sulfotransferase [Anaerolineales bacterium]MCZ2289817.1 sulfotransferase [Anaerolineales bacterium]
MGSSIMLDTQKLQTNDKNYNIEWSQRPYLIIGGTTKAATTSLYAYLKAHPQVCASSIKETRFFLDQDYPLRSKYRLEDGIEKYGEFFIQTRQITRLWVDATPDYLYSKGTPRKIKDTLTDVRFIFILREPVSRVVSWYRFAKQNNMLPKDMSLDEYILRQIDPKSVNSAGLDQPMRAVEQGRYAKYLRPYFDAFGKGRIHVIFLEELAENPLRIMQELCNFVDIDFEFYKSYKFEVHNRTEDLKSSTLHSYYKKTISFMRFKIYRQPFVKWILQKIRSVVEPLYLCLNRRASSSSENAISSQVKDALISYYRQPNRELEELLGRSLSWEERK